jgi:hypothetical protein
MATTLVYTVAPFVPFTKILSADMNQMFSDIKSRVNWAGGTNTTTGLGDDNIQSNTASGGALTRSTKLKIGTPNYIIVNDGTGKMSETNLIPTNQGGTGQNFDPTAAMPGDVIQVNPSSTAFVLSAPTAVQSSLRLYQFQQFS